MLNHKQSLYLVVYLFSQLVLACFHPPRYALLGAHDTFLIIDELVKKSFISFKTLEIVRLGLLFLFFKTICFAHHYSMGIEGHHSNRGGSTVILSEEYIHL